MYAQALSLLESPPTRPDSKDALIEILAIEGAAHARLHQFSEAENELGQALRMCQVSSGVTCGDVIRARGVLAVQQGQIDSAKKFFGESLQFARVQNDHFLEVTALLNLGVTSLREDHFDEAIDWTNSAYQASTALGARGEAQAALGNLGWAYYNLGDSERSLELSLEAEKRASQTGNAIDQLYWITNAGYVYASLGDLARAKQSYLKALDLATRINGKEGIYNCLRALALVSVESGELEEARAYSEQAIASARADNNRTNELYPLLVKGLIAARSQTRTEAEHLFREVKEDDHNNPFLKWRAERGLARLYEDEGRADLADREYRLALATFESARSSLKRNDSKLPFSTNAARIYDDYVHFLVARGKTNDALRWADYSRARTLAEGLDLLPKGASNGNLVAPPALNAPEIARRTKGALLFYWLGEKQSYLWAITSRKTLLFPLPPRTQIEAAVQRYRADVAGIEDVLASRSENGRALYAMLVAPAEAILAARPSASETSSSYRSHGTAKAPPFPKPRSSENGPKIFVIPDGGLNNLNFETLIVPGPQPHYWIEDVTIADAGSLRMLAAAALTPGTAKKKTGRRLLLIGDSVPPDDAYPRLPRAADQMESVARHFPAEQRQVFARDRATPEAYLKSNPEQFSHIHFVAHGTASRLSPLDSAIVLSRESANRDAFKLYARDIIGIEPRLRADLVTISSCKGAGERAYTGEGLVGLSWAFLRAGAHHVVAALWDVTDVSTEQLMGRFYDELDQGASPDSALRSAKLALLHGSSFHNPFYWAPFQLYAGSGT